MPTTRPSSSTAARSDSGPKALRISSPSGPGSVTWPTRWMMGTDGGTPLAAGSVGGGGANIVAAVSSPGGGAAGRLSRKDSSNSGPDCRYHGTEGSPSAASSSASACGTGSGIGPGCTAFAALLLPRSARRLVRASGSGAASGRRRNSREKNPRRAITSGSVIVIIPLSIPWCPTCLPALLREGAQRVGRYAFKGHSGR